VKAQMKTKEKEEKDSKGFNLNEFFKAMAEKGAKVPKNKDVKPVADDDGDDDLEDEDMETADEEAKEIEEKADTKRKPKLFSKKKR